MDQQKIQLGTRAENLTKNDNWIVMTQYIGLTIRQLEDQLSRGTKPEIQDGVIVKASEQVYWEAVGKIHALNMISIDFNRMIEVKNKLVKNNG